MPGLLQGLPRRARFGAYSDVLWHSRYERPATDDAMAACARPRDALRALEPWLLRPLVVLHRAPRRRAAPREQRAGRRSTLPARLTDQEFWKLSTATVRAERVSSDRRIWSRTSTRFSTWCRRSSGRVKPGGVYLGVAPDQNFTYIARDRPSDGVHRRHPARQPARAPDVQGDHRAVGGSRGVRLAAVLEEAPGRARSEVVGGGHLSRVRRGVDDRGAVPAERAATSRTQLASATALRCRPRTCSRSRRIYFAFFWDGPNMRYSTVPATDSGRGGGGFGNFPSYEELHAPDRPGRRGRSYLANEDNFRMAERSARRATSSSRSSAISPGRRRCGRWAAAIREHGAIVSAFYVSNVEQYLFQDGLFADVRAQRRDAAGRRDEHVHSIGLDPVRVRGHGSARTAGRAPSIPSVRSCATSSPAASRRMKTSTRDRNSARRIAVDYRQ